MKKRIVYDPHAGSPDRDGDAREVAERFISEVDELPEASLEWAFANERVIHEIRLVLFEGRRDGTIDLTEWELEDMSDPDDIRVIGLNRFGGYEPTDGLVHDTFLDRGVRISTKIIKIAATLRRAEIQANKEKETS